MTLGDLWGGMDYSEPTAINADASVVVGYGNTEAGQEPYLWKSGAGMKSLGTLSSRTVQAVARATSADGTVVVGSSLADNVTAIFRWTEADGMTSIATLFGNHPVGAPTSYFSIWTPPLLLSADGAVAAGTAEGSNPFTPMAFRWTASGGFEGLSTAPASIVRAASADGRRIALASGAPPFDALPYQAYLFEEGKGTRPLADVLAGVELDGMTFGDPIALSGDGQFLVGHATCAGAPAIFRAALPR
jgi:probable HAF family extracellular repeat protein